MWRGPFRPRFPEYYQRPDFRATRKHLCPGAIVSGSSVAFPRSARLLRHADFERVYKLGKRHFSSSMTVFYLQRQSAADAAGSSGFRIGFTVGRVLGGAVERNRIKRRLREVVRRCRPATGAEADIVINPKKVVLKIDFAEIEKELRRAFEVIQKNLGGRDR